MLRLPLACREDLMEELAEIDRQRETLLWAIPVSSDAAARQREGLEGLDRWSAALQAQIEEMDGVSCC